MSQAVACKKGHAADFGSMGRPLSWYQSLAKHIDVVVLDMMSKGWTQDYHYALQAGLGVTVFQGYEPADFAKPVEAKLRARMMVSAVNSVGLAKNSDVFLDWESVPSGVSEAAALNWLEAWAKEVATAGVAPGLYEGPDQPVSAQAVQQRLKGYRVMWRSASAVPTLAQTGYVLDQTHGNVTHNGYKVDWDVIQPDKRGRSLTVTKGSPATKSQAPPTAPASPASSSPSQQLTALMRKQQETAKQLSNIVETLHQVGTTLGGL